MSAPLQFPQISSNLIEIGPFVIRWYALAYIAGLLLGWQVLRRLVGMAPVVASKEQADDYLTWATLGVVLGGRIGYVLFYQPTRFLAAPLEAFAVWQGGMSFHGGLLGVVLATIWFCNRNVIPVLGFGDRLAVGVPIGLFFGRLANFINGELWGRPAAESVPWRMVFPHVDALPRHPSQLYQALLEGLALFVLMWVLSRRDNLRARLGFLTGVFAAGYGVARITGEFFRQPDAFLGFLYAGATMGQLLSIPMVLIGIWLMLRTDKIAA
ncbi:MAG: prolipoprotein diacylglyceryl transferase [Acetobacteraceae bacterium]|nr:prolipoprotein diacylglyceryl transferase [Acetobacteraceae bacterium]